MKNLKTSLEPLQTLNLLYQYYLFIKDQQPVRKDQLPVQFLVMKTVSTAMSTVLYPDLYVPTNDEHWIITPETHKYAAAAGPFCFVTTENGDQQDICNLTTIPCVQRSLYLNEMIDDFGNVRVEVPKGVDCRTRDVLERCMANCGRAAGTRPKRRSRARKEASAQEVRGYYKQFAEAKHLEYKSCVDNEVFDLIDLSNFKPINYVTGRWVFTFTLILRQVSFKDSLMV